MSVGYNNNANKTANFSVFEDPLNRLLCYNYYCGALLCQADPSQLNECQQLETLKCEVIDVINNPNQYREFLIKFKFDFKQISLDTPDSVLSSTNFINFYCNTGSLWSKTVYPTIVQMMPPYKDGLNDVLHIFPLMMNFQDYNLDVFNVVPKTYADGIQQIGSMLAILSFVSTILFILNRYVFNKKQVLRIKSINGMGNEKLEELLTFDQFYNMKKTIDLQQSQINQLLAANSFSNKEQSDVELTNYGETKDQNKTIAEAIEENKDNIEFSNIQ
ncbi:UNKNOWN [Stylonychia lemnae]|uniref:Transmembrane protein n=1 Tax=Stylonychia lemnae TaxID=5949 RepID=A0A078A8F0_STYLE|nr:UNKNOWN [Stylonychia lemnae]|eukprot:CDW78504.1 UNKNOWN [Stylonychia lemnae]